MPLPKWYNSVSPVSAFEVPGTRQESQDGFDSRCEVQVMVAWADRYNFITNLYDPTGDFPELIVNGQSINAEWPFNDGMRFPCFFNSGVITQQIAKADTLSTFTEIFTDYEFAIIDLLYTFPRQETSSGTSPGGDKIILSERIRPNAEFIKLNTDTLYYSGKEFADLNTINSEAPVLPESQLGIQWRRLGIERTLQGLAAFPSTWVNHIGKTNIAAYASDLLGLTFPPETLLVLDVTAEFTLTALGNTNWTSTVSLAGKNDGPFAEPRGWNTFFDGKETDADLAKHWKGVFSSSQAGEARIKSYPPVDLSDMLYNPIPI